MVSPFYWMVTTALKELAEATLFPPTLWPTRWHVENFETAWRTATFGQYFLNTIIVAVIQTGMVLVTSALAAYGFARVRFFGRDIIFICFLGTLMVPVEVELIPNFLILKHLGWYDTYAALIVPWGTSVMGIFCCGSSS